MMMLPIMLVTLAVSVLMVMMSNSWIIIWVSLEMNTLSFCSILNMSFFQKKMAEPSMKYFIIQSTTSAIMILYLSVPSEIHGTKLLFFSGTAAMLIKLAASPFHSWFMEILPKISMATGTLLMTWQKMAPVYLLIFMMKPVIYTSIVLSSLFGSLSQLNKSKMMEILALSSIFNISWTLMAMMTSTQTMFTFLLAYWTALLFAVLTLMKVKANEMTKNPTSYLSPWSMIIMMASLGGLPPTLGFYAKIQTATQALKFSMKEIVTVLMVISAINFYIYLRFTSTSLFFTPTKTQKNQEKTWKKFMPMIMLNLTPLAILTL